MAKIDKFIDMMTARHVERALIIGDKPLQIFISGQKKEGPVITADQLRQALYEVTPDHLRSVIDTGGSFDFIYDSPQGPFAIYVETFFDSVQVKLVPGKLVPQAPSSQTQKTSSQSARPQAASQTIPLPQLSSPSGLIKCPYCSEDIQPNAQKCKHCGEWLIPQPQNAPLTPVLHASVGQQAAALGGQSYIHQSSAADEVTIYCAKLHWIVSVAPGLTSIFLFFMGIGTISLSGSLAVIIFLISLAILGAAVTRYISSEFAVTNKRLLSKVGFISRRSNELMLQKVEGVMVEQGLLGRMLNYGTLVVTGTGGSKEQFPNIAEPLEFRKQIQLRLPS